MAGLASARLEQASRRASLPVRKEPPLYVASEPRGGYTPPERDHMAQSQANTPMPHSPSLYPVRRS